MQLGYWNYSFQLFYLHPQLSQTSLCRNRSFSKLSTAIKRLTLVLKNEPLLWKKVGNRNSKDFDYQLEQDFARYVINKACKKINSKNFTGLDKI